MNVSAPFSASPSSGPVFPPNQASILWYPNESHTELAIGNRIYQTFSGYLYKRTIEESIRVAENGGSGFYRFALELSDVELARLKTHIDADENRHSEKICVRGASEAVTMATGMPIPFPANISPLWNGAFLSAAYYSGFTRVTGMEHYGQRPWFGLGAALEATLSAVPPLILSGLGFAGYVGYQYFVG